MAEFDDTKVAEHLNTAAERIIKALGSKTRRLLSRQWRIEAWDLAHRGETYYMPAYRGLRFGLFPGWWKVGSPFTIGYVAFATDDEAVAFCNALAPASVEPSGAEKSTWTPKLPERSSDDGLATGVVAGIVLGGILS